MADPKSTKDNESELVEVVALERGHCGTNVREEGERFFVPRARLQDGSTWFAEPGKAKAKSEGKPASGKRPPGAGPLPQ